MRARDPDAAGADLHGVVMGMPGMPGTCVVTRRARKTGDEDEDDPSTPDPGNE